MLTDDPTDPPAAGGHYGVSYWGGLGTPALIGYFPGSQGDRERFTLAHEVGHLVLQARVSAGMDPSTGERIVLPETVPIPTMKTAAARERAELDAYKAAEKALTRLPRRGGCP